MSQDTDSTTTHNLSMGPALVGNISVDSLDEHQPQQLSRGSLTLNANASDHLDAPIYTTGGDTKALLEPDLNVSAGPTVREAEEYADQMTSEILEEVRERSRQFEAQYEQPQQHNQDPEHKEEAEKVEDPVEQEIIVVKKQVEEEKEQQEEAIAVAVEEEEEEKEEEEEEKEKEKEEGKEPKKEEASIEEPEGKADYTEEVLQENSSETPLVEEDSVSLIKLHDNTNNELFHQTFKTAGNITHYSQFEDDKSIMEFTKNYSDDLMGSSELQRGTGGPDLADFELPAYSGSSSSSSEQAASTTTAPKHSPAKQRKSSNAMTQAPSSSQVAASSGTGPDLSAVKKILISTYSEVAHIFHWERPIESGVVFAIGLTLIIALTFFSIISVVAYTALGIILASGLIRIYKSSMKALNRSSETPVDHIWERVLSVDVSMSPERLHELVDSSHVNLSASLVYFKQVLLVEDKIATTKFFLFLYSLTYIGSWFNGLTLITIIYLSVFSVPKLYENHKTNIDGYVKLATDQFASTVSMVTSKLGAGSKKQN